MTTKTTRSTTAAAVAVIALLLTGCGGGGGESTEPEAELGAIDQLYEDIYGDYDAEDSNQQMIQIEEITAECMAEEGFDYTPVDYSQSGGAVASTDDGIEEEWGTLEFAKKWGYGSTTNPYGEATEEPVETEDEWIDPNQEYVESMSESEQNAYYTALYGEQWNAEYTEEMESEEYVWDWTTAGCSGLAQNEVYGDTSGTTDGEFADLEAELQTMWESISSDPRLAEVAADWATCMASAGYPGLADVTDAENLIYDQVNALWEDAYADVPADADEEEWSAIEESIQEDLDAITPEEIKTATADYTCRDEVAYTRTQSDVNIALQQEFYDLHKEELIAWAEAMSDGK